MRQRHSYSQMMLHWLLVIGLTASTFVVLIIASFTLNYVGSCIGWDLYPSILRSRRAIIRILRMRGENFRVHSFGATRIDPKYLCVCIDVDTDAERDAMLKDSELINSFRDAVRGSGYPAESIPLISFSIESQQTVDRDFGGNWFYARK